MKIYLVGGAVRDELLGLDVVDRDWVVVGGTPAEMQSLGYIPVGKSFPVFLHPKTKEEYALARTEKKSGHGYHGFTFHAGKDVSLVQDLARRDITINAIAKDDNGNLIDPYNGQADLNARLLKHVSQAFSEDPVRLLRVARFLARYAHRDFKIASQTHKLMAEMVTNNEVDHLVPERVFQELNKALEANSPWEFFLALKDCGALARLFPELDNLWGVPNPAKYHPEVDTGLHTILVLKSACKLTKLPHVRFAALLHDLGKATTKPEYWPKHHGHEERGVSLVNSLCKRLKAPKIYSELALLVCKYHGKCHRALELKTSSIVQLLQSLDVFRKPVRFNEFLIACSADAKGCQGLGDRDYPQAERLQRAYTILKSQDLAHITNSKLTGKEIKQKIYEERVRILKEQL